MALSVLQFGADPTGVSDSTAAFNAAFVATSRVLVPAGFYRLNGTVTMTAGSQLIGEGNPSVETRLSPGITMASNCVVRGIKFDLNTNLIQNVRVLYFPFPAVPSHCIIDRCDFQFGTGDSAIYAENGTNDNIVRDCTFGHGSNGILINGGSRWLISGNEFYACSRPIQYSGGNYNVITGNRTNGGTIGIIFLSLATNGVNNVTIGNIIADNQIVGCTEEGISLDCRGNTSTQWPENKTNPLVTFASGASGSPSQFLVTISETGQVLNWATGYYAIPLSGNNTGAVYYISASNDGIIGLERSNGDGGAWTVGDKLLITLPFLQNVITGNTCVGCGTAGISLWGSSWYNVISDNTLTLNKYYGVQLASVVAGLGSPGAWGVQAWSGGNIIDHNTINCIELNAAVTDPGGPISVRVAQFGTPPSSVVWMPNNVVRDNLCASMKPIQVDAAARTELDGNKTLAGGGIELIDTDATIFGNNTSVGVRISPTLTGVNTNLVTLQAVAQANIGAAPSQSDFNTLLTNLRAAQVIAP